MGLIETGVKRSKKFGYITPYGIFPGFNKIYRETEPPESRKRLAEWASKQNDPDLYRRRGVLLHEVLEKGVLSNSGAIDLPDDISSIEPFLGAAMDFLEGFRDKYEVLLVEQGFYHIDGFGGTADLLLREKVSGKIILLDWKTARKRKNDRGLVKYQLQMVAYTYGLDYFLPKIGYNLPIDEAMLIIFPEWKPAQIKTFSKNSVLKPRESLWKMRLQGYWEKVA
mgnify:CR=1 FL=1